MCNGLMLTDGARLCDDNGQVLWKDHEPELNINQLATPRVGSSTPQWMGSQPRQGPQIYTLAFFFGLRMHAHSLSCKETFRLLQKSTCMCGEASASDAFRSEFGHHTPCSVHGARCGKQMFVRNPMDVVDCVRLFC
jgi:hypothetical protein